jgi:ubiquinone biosynthesis protein UbiJ
LRSDDAPRARSGAHETRAFREPAVKLGPADRLAGNLASGIANRTLGRESWAREKLAAHAGRVFAVGVGPLTAMFRIDAQGALEGVPSDAGMPDLRLALSPLDLPAFLADPRRWNEYVREDGDVALGGTLKELAQTLPWFVEQAFERAFGAIFGQRLADAGRHALAFPAQASSRLAQSVGRYARDEAHLIVRDDEMRVFAEETAAIAARVDALETRVAALTPSR